MKSLHARVRLYIYLRFGAALDYTNSRKDNRVVTSRLFKSLSILLIYNVVL